MRNIRFILFTASVLGLSACGHASIDPEIQPYVDRFVQDTGVTIVTPMNIQFGDLADASDGEEDGICQPSSTGAFTITIDSSAWAGYDDIGKEMIVYHELGHCLLGRGHKNDLDNNGSPLSYMYQDPEMNWANYDERKPALIQEMLHGN